MSDFRVVAFATHGLLVGDIVGVSQPGLLLTPPAINSKENNGILTASEIAELEFDAEWIILSACNTAPPDGTPGAENLSGLARAFFLAGARRLFVSHWKVETFAAKKITTQMFDYLKSNWSMGRAQAHQKSIMTLINSNDVFTRHPAIWGAFTVVGDT